MKILYVTRIDVPIQHEHVFISAVYNEMCRQKMDVKLATVGFDSELSNVEIEESSWCEKLYYKLKIPESCKNNIEKIVSAFVCLLNRVQPDVIHSNMEEAYEVEAAHLCNIPVFVTIHIGSFICPRGGGDSFLMHNDSICTRPISSECIKCVSRRLPLPAISYLLLRYTPNYIVSFLKRILRKPRFYITAFITYCYCIQDSLRRIKTFRYATLIAANERLKDVLELNKLINNVVVIPHGVKKRRKLPMPRFQNGNPIKFFYIGRIQYSKGLHVLLDALKTINPSLYELHILGDADSSRTAQHYYSLLKRKAKKSNVFFHGAISNSCLEEYVKDYHVMIHPAICLEIYGIAIAEALSMGRPVLATRCGGPQKQIQDMVNGWLCDVDSVSSLRMSISQLLEQPTEIWRCASNAETPHPIDLYVEKLYELFQSKV